MSTYYLYRHIRLDKNEPFYIGYSRKYRGKEGKPYLRAFNKNARNHIWKRIKAKTKYEVEILIESESEKFILEREKEFIKLYGRIDLGTGTLANLTDGGEGSNGYKPSKETIEKNRKSQMIKVICKNTGQIFDCIKDAALLYNIFPPVLSTQLKKNHPNCLFKYAEESKNKEYIRKNTIKVVNLETNEIIYSISEAARREGINESSMNQNIKYLKNYKYQFLDENRNKLRKKEKLKNVKTKILNKENGMLFNSIKEAAEYLNIPYNVFKNSVIRKKDTIFERIFD